MEVRDLPPQLSVVIPVYNEEAVLPALFERLYAALDALQRSYEVIFVDDGSRDRSAALLRAQFERRPRETRVVLLATNAGQHLAVMAGFERCRGEYVVTLDADLQNPPEEIAKLVAKLAEGYDYVGGVRRERQDNVFRRSASRLINRLRERTTRIRVTDHGCMLRGYRRPVVAAINSCREVNTFIPALAYTFSARPVEIEVDHEARSAGRSKYSLLRLLRLNFDLMTGFSLVPLQVFSVIGMATSVVAAISYCVLLVRRILSGELSEGLMALVDRDIIGFFLVGLLLFGVGLLGEYVGRIYEQVRHRPRYLVSAVLEAEAPASSLPPEHRRPFRSQVR